MAIRKILTIGDEQLRKPTHPITKFDEKLWTLLDDMTQTMYEAPGVGLAAPQVGILRQVVVIDVGEGLVELVNPTITKTEGLQCGMEGCLSVPGRQAVVLRPQNVTVKAQDRFGKEIEIDAQGYFARAIAHELDHLKGQLYVDIMDEELFEEDDWEEKINEISLKYEGAVKDE